MVATFRPIWEWRFPRLVISARFGRISSPACRCLPQRHELVRGVFMPMPRAVLHSITGIPKHLGRGPCVARLPSQRRSVAHASADRSLCGQGDELRLSCSSGPGKHLGLHYRVTIYRVTMRLGVYPFAFLPVSSRPRFTLYTLPLHAPPVLGW